jgi:hypothetical protein
MQRSHRRTRSVTSYVIIRFGYDEHERTISSVVWHAKRWLASDKALARRNHVQSSSPFASLRITHAWDIHPTISKEEAM